MFMSNICFSNWELRLLTLPSETRIRHKVTYIGRTEATHIHPIHLRLLQSIVVRMGHLSEICETLKQEGLPPNEVRQLRSCLLHRSLSQTY